MADVGQFAEAVAGGLGRGPLIPVSPLQSCIIRQFRTGLAGPLRSPCKKGH